MRRLSTLMILLVALLAFGGSAQAEHSGTTVDNDCNDQFNLCYTGCQAYGPPSPNCTYNCRISYQYCTGAEPEGGYRVQ